MSNKFLNHEDLYTGFKYARNHVFSVNGLAIKAGSSADAKTAANTVVMFDTAQKTLAAQTTLDLSTAEGTLAIPAGQTGYVYCWLDSDGATVTFTSIVNDAHVPYVIGWDADGDADKWFTAGSTACIGVIKIVNATASAFTVGTTALDTTNITATYLTPSFLIPGQEMA
jgi:hypothetical protein